MLEFGSANVRRMTADHVIDSLRNLGNGSSLNSVRVTHIIVNPEEADTEKILAIQSLISQRSVKIFQVNLQPLLY